MTDLYPTPTRVELAKSIAAGNVLEDWCSDHLGEIEERSMGRTWKVTGKVNPMRASGLCETSPRDDDCDFRATRLTTKGEQWLITADPTWSKETR